MRMLLGQLVIETKLFLRDRQSVFWTFFFPVFMILLRGFVFGRGDAMRFAVGVVDEDRSVRSQELIAALSEVPVLRLEEGSRDEILRELREIREKLDK